jgi:hypothetical protein
MFGLELSGKCRDLGALGNGSISNLTVMAVRLPQSKALGDLMKCSACGRRSTESQGTAIWHWGLGPLMVGIEEQVKGLGYDGN